MGKSAKGKKGTFLIRVWTLTAPPTPPSKVPGSPPLLETFVQASSNVTLPPLKLDTLSEICKHEGFYVSVA